MISYAWQASISSWWSRYISFLPPGQVVFRLMSWQDLHQPLSQPTAGRTRLPAVRFQGIEVGGKGVPMKVPPPPICSQDVDGVDMVSGDSVSGA